MQSKDLVCSPGLPASVRAEREIAGQCVDETLQTALLTGGWDRPYAIGMALALSSHGIRVDFIASDELSTRELLNNPKVRFLRLLAVFGPETSFLAKVLKVIGYYVRLFLYTATASPKLFHILWNNKFEFFDRTVLMLYYKLLGKRIVFTAHNVNARKRDAEDSFLNRLSLKVQYTLSDHIFVHTERMKTELVSDFGIRAKKVSVIPFGINNTVPNTEMTSVQAKSQLNVNLADKTLLFFGNITSYKGLEYLIAAFTELARKDRSYRLIIAGNPKGSNDYCNRIRQAISQSDVRDRIIQRIEYIPDEETELYFKAADVLVLPYTRIFQSGVLFLGYGFGLPVIAADVASLKEEIVEGETGSVFRPRDSADLAKAICQYFESKLFRELESRREHIKCYANERYSWDKVAAITTTVYSRLLTTDY